MFEILREILANYYVLYLKTQGYHWNCKGRDFFLWHEQFEKQYLNITEAIDTIAELIREINRETPADFKTYSEYSTIKLETSSYDVKNIVRCVINDNEIILKILSKSLSEVEKHDDVVVADFLVQRMTYHKKILWMMKSSNE